MPDMWANLKSQKNPVFSCTDLRHASARSGLASYILIPQVKSMPSSLAKQR